jgi:DNA mismatch endonuclease (patch repair protein)
MDFLSAIERSKQMALVRAKNTQPELRVRTFLHSRGFRFRLHRRDLPGKPDIVLPKYKIAIFVHGCFWHACPNCKKGSRLPTTNAVFWAEKIRKNVERDERSRQLVEAAGWKVIIVWECLTKNKTSLAKVLARHLAGARRKEQRSIRGLLSPQSSHRASEK